MSRVNHFDMAAGGMFVAVGTATIWLSKDYPVGWTIRMGPGYFPTALGWLLIGLGAIICASSVFSTSMGPAQWKLRPVLILALSAVAFGVTMDVLKLGLVPALIAVTGISACSQKGMSWSATLLLCIGVCAACVLVFVIGLGLAHPLFWSSQ